VGEDGRFPHRDDDQLVKRKVAIALAVAGAALLVLCGLGVGGLAWMSGQLGVTPQWTVVHSAPAQLHVKTTARDLHFRETGFQDPHYELLFEVSDVDTFLEENRLVRGPASVPAVNDAPVKATSAIELDGFVDDQLFRSGQLWDVAGRTYVYLVAFGT
jgi:hypothetical protein